MPVETAEDRAALFHPDDFGVELVARTTCGYVSFNGILSTSAVADQTSAMSASATTYEPVIITTKLAAAALQQGDTIALPGTDTHVQIVDMRAKGEIVVIHYHEVY